MKTAILKYQSLFMTAFVFALSLSQLFAQELSWTGCGITKKAFMKEIAKAYEAKTGVKIVLTGGGATKGIRAASAGSSDLGGNCRHALVGAGGQILPAEAEATMVQVAWDAIVVIAHADNPLEDISLKNLKKVFAGEITSWKDLGSPLNKRIVLCTRKGKTSGVGYMFRLLAYNDPEHVFKARSMTFKSSGPLEKKIEESPAALGISGISSARKKAVKILSIDGIKPTKEAIESGKYPLFRPLYISTNKKQKAEVKKFIDFILSPEGQAIISKQGTVNLAEGKALQPLWNKKKAMFGI